MKKAFILVLAMIIVLSSVSLSVSADDGTNIGNKEGNASNATSSFEQTIPTTYTIVIPAKLNVDTYSDTEVWMKSSGINVADNQELRVNISSLDTDNCVLFTSEYGNHQFRREIVRITEGYESYPANCVGLYMGQNRGSSIKFNFAEGCYQTNSKTLIEKPFAGKYSASVEFELELVTLDMSQGE